jgi:hypothetical protein
MNARFQKMSEGNFRIDLTFDLLLDNWVKIFQKTQKWLKFCFFLLKFNSELTFYGHFIIDFKTDLNSAFKWPKKIINPDLRATHKKKKCPGWKGIENDTRESWITWVWRTKEIKCFKTCDSIDSSKREHISHLNNWCII